VISYLYTRRASRFLPYCCVLTGHVFELARVTCRVYTRRVGQAYTLKYGYFGLVIGK
jgi:hypothetical protein